MYKNKTTGASAITPNDIVEFLPKELLTAPQWVCWRYRNRSGGKPSKVPVDATTGERADITDSECYSNYKRALQLCEYGQLIDSPTEGIGFVFTPNDHYVGIDLDNCVDKDGTLTEWSQDIIEKVGSYTEYSPSGNGIHIIARGKLPEGNTRNEGIELYEQKRYFTVTGQQVPSTHCNIVERSAQLDLVYDEYIATEPDSDDSAMNTGGGVVPPTSDSGNHSDEALLEKANNAKNGEKFARLWEGNTSGYASHSEADQALCCRLAFWTGGDRKWIDRLFRQSHLMRSKWDDRHYADGRTYGEATIDTALSMVTNYYNWN